MVADRLAHGRPVVNGYTGHFPGPYNMLRQALRERDPSVLQGLATFGPLCIVIDRRQLPARNSRLMTEAAGARLVGTEREFAFYILDRQPAPEIPGTPAAPIVSALGNGWPTPVKAPIDKRVNTYWESLTRQRGSEGMTLTLQEVAIVRGIALALGARAGGYPRHLIVETSLDGQAWIPAWEGPTAGLAYRAAVLNFDSVRFGFTFEPRAARFVRLRQGAVAEDAYWTIAEVEVLR